MTTEEILVRMMYPGYVVLFLVACPLMLFLADRYDKLHKRTPFPTGKLVFLSLSMLAVYWVALAWILTPFIYFALKWAAQQ
jgi:hypothetical protein